MLFILIFFAVKQMHQKHNNKEYVSIDCQYLKTFQYVSKAITVEVVQAYAAKTVSSQDFVTGWQAIVTEGVNKDGQDANVINVKLCFLSSLYSLYCESHTINITMNFTSIKLKKEIFIKGYKCLNLKTCTIYLCWCCHENINILLSLLCVFIFQRTLQSVSPDTLGKIVRTYAALTVYMITYATGLQDNVNMGVNLDGQEADVINVRPKFYIYSIKSLINCFYSRQCGLSRGHCSNGCTPGWTGRRCSQIKLFSHFY